MLKNHVTLECRDTHAIISLSHDFASGCKAMVLNTDNHAFKVFVSRDEVVTVAQPAETDVLEIGDVVDHTTNDPMSADGTFLLLANATGPMNFTEQTAEYGNCFKMKNQVYTTYMYIYTNAGTTDNPTWVMDAARS